MIWLRLPLHKPNIMWDINVPTTSCCGFGDKTMLDIFDQWECIKEKATGATTPVAFSDSRVLNGPCYHLCTLLDTVQSLYPQCSHIVNKSFTY